MGNSSGKVKFDNDKIAFNVITVQPDSPGAVAGLREFIDFILEVNGKSIKNMTPLGMLEICKKHENQPVKLKVFDKVLQEERDAILVPTTSWPNAKGLLGITVRLDNYDDVTKKQTDEKKRSVDRGSDRSSSDLRGSDPRTSRTSSSSSGQLRRQQSTGGNQRTNFIDGDNVTHVSSPVKELQESTSTSGLPSHVQVDQNDVHHITSPIMELKLQKQSDAFRQPQN